MGTNRFKALAVAIQTHKHKILSSLVGLLLTVCSFFIYHHFRQSNTLIWFVCILNVSFAYYQIHRYYLDEKDWTRIGKITLGIIFIFFFIMMITIVMGIFSFLVLDSTFYPEFFLYAIFITPSFVIALILLMILIAISG